MSGIKIKCTISKCKNITTLTTLQQSRPDYKWSLAFDFSVICKYQRSLKSFATLSSRHWYFLGHSLVTRVPGVKTVTRCVVNLARLCLTMETPWLPQQLQHALRFCRYNGRLSTFQPYYSTQLVTNIVNHATICTSLAPRATHFNPPRTVIFFIITNTAVLI